MAEFALANTGLERTAVLDDFWRCMLQPNGRLNLATPMGRHRVEFNANLLFAPRTILSCAEQQGLHLDRLHSLRGEAGLVEHSRSEWPQLLDWLGSQP